MTAWYNANENRRYPFLDDPTQVMTRTSDRATISLPDDAIVDFRAIVGPSLFWVPGSSFAYLAEVARPDSGTLVFTINSSSDALVFTVPLTTPEFTAFDTAGAGMAGPCGSGFTWQGTLVIGQLAALAALLTPGDSLTATSFTGPQFEPVTTILTPPIVTSISVGNVDRLRVPAPGPPAIALDARTNFVWTKCMTGELALRPGFNCAIRQDPRTETLTISAEVGSEEATAERATARVGAASILEARDNALGRVSEFRNTETQGDGISRRVGSSTADSPGCTSTSSQAFETLEAIRMEAARVVPTRSRWTL
jgi:hypothetical protein